MGAIIIIDMDRESASKLLDRHDGFMPVCYCLARPGRGWTDIKSKVTQLVSVLYFSLFHYGGYGLSRRKSKVFSNKWQLDSSLDSSLRQQSNGCWSSESVLNDGGSISVRRDCGARANGTRTGFLLMIGSDYYCN